MSEGLQGSLAFAGTLLFLLGLLTGAGIPFFRGPRIGLSAHVAAIQSGLALIAVAWLGGRLALSEGWAAAIAHGLWISLYVLWVGLVFAAIYGTGRTLPLAGKGLAADALAGAHRRRADRRRLARERASPSQRSLPVVAGGVGLAQLRQHPLADQAQALLRRRSRAGRRTSARSTG